MVHLIPCTNVHREKYARDVKNGTGPQHHRNSLSGKKFRKFSVFSVISDVSSHTTKNVSNRLEMRTHKSATVLISVVILFLLTHCYRIALKVFEVSTPNTNTMETFMMCFAKNR